MYETLLFLVAAMRHNIDRGRTALKSDDGISTLELIVLGLGVFLLAGAAVAVITNAVNNRTSQIN